MCGCVAYKSDLSKVKRVNCMEKSELKIVKLSELKESNTNPEGRTKGEAFKDLVASIKEKGVLVPILVRYVHLPGKNNLKVYEIVAGHRRFAAAKEAGLTEIPVNFREMNDIEAREAQIVENMQREDVHPLDEAQAFKFLVEECDLNVTEISKRVGKSERYVRDRLGLTNLGAAGEKMFRSGEMSLTVAILLSKCDVEKIKKEALERVKNEWSIGNLREFIASQMYAHYGSKPWSKDENLSKILGDVKGATLFKQDTEEVDDPVEHAKRMAAYIEIQVRKYEHKGEKIVKISTGYGSPDTKGVLGKDQYRLLETDKEKKAAKEDIAAIVVEGYENVGRILRVSTHPDDLKKSGSGAAHALTKEEKEARKKKRAEEDKKELARQEKILKSMEKVKMPMSEKQLDILFDICFRRFGYSYLQPVAKRHGIKPVVTNVNNWMRRDLETPLRKHFEEKGNDGKLQFIFEVGMEATGESGDNVDSFLKKL